MERQESSVFYSAYLENRIQPPSKLMQSLFELCVVVGMDEDTGLIPLSRVRRINGLLHNGHILINVAS